MGKKAEDLLIMNPVIEQRTITQVVEENRRSLMIYSTVMFFLTIALVVSSFFSNTMSEYRYVYLSGVVYSIVMLLVLKFLAPKSRYFVRVCMLSFIVTLLSIGLFLGTFIDKDSAATTLVAFLVLAPLLFAEQPLFMNTVMVVFIIAGCASSAYYKSEELWKTDTINIVVFGFLGMFVGYYTSSIKLKRFQLQERIRYMGEMDILTDLKNRNSFETRLIEYNKMPVGNTVCTYIDVNGLHELNNTKGHDAGDEMLKCIASLIKRQFGEEHTYRTGGDEFVAFAFDVDDNEMSRRLEHIKRGAQGNQYSVAVGYSRGKEDDEKLSAVIKRAEENMFADKKAFYNSLGNDRRARG